MSETLLVRRNKMLHVNENSHLETILLGLTTNTPVIFKISFNLNSNAFVKEVLLEDLYSNKVDH